MKNLNEETFVNETARDTVLVDFFAEWCGPCKMLSPILHEIENERTDISICKVNIDDNFELAKAYKVMSIPTMIVFKDGKESARIVGYCSKDEILAEL
jgi:thioredoxin 1